METAERNRNAVIGLLGLLVVASLFGWWWLANRDERSESDHWIVFQRDGGIQGLSDNLTLEEDGEAVLRDDLDRPTVEYDVSDQLMEGVRDALDEVDWNESNALHEAPPCCDFIYYTIQHEGWFASGAGTTPDEETLGPLIEVLGSVIESARGN